eukprot:c19284_g1_i5.p2 GENE.c19284_g1_i5~~c19284_g1_i5.p2  ORF type:complete len:154 (+),score=18.14 c19284_g1_i5:578-1039(+)
MASPSSDVFRTSESIPARKESSMQCCSESDFELRLEKMGTLCKSEKTHLDHEAVDARKLLHALSRLWCPMSNSLNFNISHTAPAATEDRARLTEKLKQTAANSRKKTPIVALKKTRHRQSQVHQQRERELERMRNRSRSRLWKMENNPWSNKR